MSQGNRSLRPPSLSFRDRIPSSKTHSAIRARPRRNPRPPCRNARKFQPRRAPLRPLRLRRHPTRNPRRPRSDLPRLPRVGLLRAERHRPLPQVWVQHLGQAPHGHRILPARKMESSSHHGEHREHGLKKLSSHFLPSLLPLRVLRVLRGENPRGFDRRARLARQ